MLRNRHEKCLLTVVQLCLRSAVQDFARQCPINTAVTPETYEKIEPEGALFGSRRAEDWRLRARGQPWDGALLSLGSKDSTPCQYQLSLLGRTESSVAGDLARSSAVRPSGGASRRSASH